MTQRDKTIAILLPDLRPGGTEQVRLLLAHEFAKRGYQVDFVLARASGALLDEIPETMRVIDLGAQRLRKALPGLIRYLKDERPYGLLAAAWPLTAIAAVAHLRSGCKTRLVLSEHTHLSRSAAIKGPSRLLLRALGKHIYRQADGVVTVSDGVRRDLCAQTGLSPEEVRVVYNGVRRPPLGREPDYSPSVKRWRATDGLKIIAVGSLKEAKNYPNLFKALSLLVTRGIDAKLLILGEGPLLHALELWAIELGLADRLTLGGHQSNIYPYLSASDIYVLSSDWEGLPGSLIEALASGLPVVATDCPSGPSEILAGGRFGRLVPVDNNQALADAIAEEVRDPTDRTGLDAHLAKFTIENAATGYLNAFGDST